MKGLLKGRSAPKMSSQTKPQRIASTENPVKEIWSMLSYFESEYNARQYLKEKFRPNDTSLNSINKTAKNLAFTMKTAREYYEAAESVTVLTQPLLIFYGMTALSKVLFMATHGKKSPSTSHGLKKIKPWTGVFAKLSVKIGKNGTFPQFHGCYNRERLHGADFSIKELFSVVPEAKVAFERVYNEKSKALRILRIRHGISIIDSELQRYEDLEDLITRIPGIKERYHKQYQRFDDRIILFCTKREAEDPVTRAVSGDEYIVLPIIKQGKSIMLPDMSTHFLIMYLLGMLTRYQPKEWGEIMKGEESGEIYMIQHFLEVTKRKFPNLVLNELLHRDFVFMSPKFDVGQGRLDDEQMEKIYEYVSRKMAEELSRHM